MREEDNRDWSVPDEEWIDVGDDCVFIGRQDDGAERWFRLRDDYFSQLMEAVTERCPPPRLGLVAAYLVGLGRWGDAPWIAPDFEQAIAQLSSVSDEVLEAELGGRPQLVLARRDLVAFLRQRQDAGDTLIVDDGSGRTGRFPTAGSGWTETGRPAQDSLLVRYVPNSEALVGFDPETIRVPNGALTHIVAAKASTEAARMVLEFFADGDRRGRRVVDVPGLIRALSPCDGFDPQLATFLEQASRHGWPVVLQSAGRFPQIPPP